MDPAEELPSLADVIRRAKSMGMSLPNILRRVADGSEPSFLSPGDEPVLARLHLPRDLVRDLIAQIPVTAVSP